MWARAAFVSGDWLAPNGLAAVEGPFDVVVSNPPYIPANDIEGLEPDVRQYEPRIALDGGADGLDAYRAIIKRLPALLVDGGLAAFEVGIGQAEAVGAMLEQQGFTVLEARADLGGIARAVVARINS